MNCKSETQDLFVKSRDKWFMGKWKELRLLTAETIQDHPSRKELAIIVATAWQQINDVDKVKFYITLALEWGCSKYKISQFLIAGLFNTLGCIKAIQNQGKSLLPTFINAVEIDNLSNLDSLVLAEMRMREEFKNLNKGNIPIQLSSLDRNFDLLEPAVTSISTVSRPANTQKDYQQLIVLGMHRSGTSCITNLLQNMGAYFGSSTQSTGKSDENPKGFWERRDMRHITDSLLSSVNCDWSKVSDFYPDKVPSKAVFSALTSFDNILNDLNQKNVWVLKEPRLCLLLPLLRSRLNRPIAVCVFRNPLEVALSLQKRNRFPLIFGLALWEFYTLSMINNTTDMDRIFISYNGLMDNPVNGSTQICSALKKLGLPLEVPKDADLLYLVDKNLYRNKIYSYELEEIITIRQLRLYESMRNHNNSIINEIGNSLRESLAFYENNF